MKFDTFFTRLQEVENIGKLEAGYSHIVFDLFYNHVWDKEQQKKYILVDVSTLKRKYGTNHKNVELLGKNLCAVPDFVITNKTDKLNEIIRYGCIEVKIADKDVDLHKPNDNRLKNGGGKIGYLKMYNNKVISTNGWIWNYYDEGKETPEWRCDFRKKENQNDDYLNYLIDKLQKIGWKNKTPVQI